MKLSNFVEGLQILREYYTDKDGYHIGAEHDQFYAYATDYPLSEEHLKRMRELGWFQPDSTEDQYRMQDGWSAFT